ncbi:uncharacterized protein LOC130737123 [Lotus japonicus]|uniref:uncharacterized protein LOC130737123 n=1 Tax=Lotus japonicus TaxID=34305 RepID=UPI002584E7BC|nr:uncharacterized protein LOC130737123 [Lotus japonicus]
MYCIFTSSWLKHGDRNTRFFHQKANQRRKRNLIEFLKDDQGREVVEDPDIARVLGDYFTGRLITNNALVAYECFHFMKKRISGRNGMMALKLDMSKAYDRVEWPFLQGVLQKMRFPPSWVSLIMSCVTTVRFSIMLNGNPQPNDSIIFAIANSQEAECVLDVLSIYEKASGQVIKLDKSMLSVSRNVPHNGLDELKQLLNVKAVESFDKYIGLPIMIECSQTIKMAVKRKTKAASGQAPEIMDESGSF